MGGKKIRVFILEVIKLNILLTGVAGFIGSKTAEFLLNNGNFIIGIDNLNDYYAVKLKEYRLKKIIADKNFKFFKIDIENYDALEIIFDLYDFDAVINLAARAGVGYSIEDPFVYASTNYYGTLNLLELMKINKVKKLVLASTSSLYAGQKMPFKEDLPVNTPISPYAASKKAAEAMAYTYHYLYDIDISVVRYFTVYGPAGRPDMSIFRFIKWIVEGNSVEIFGDGSQSRDFTYVDDIAKGTILALKNVGYEVINLGGGKNPITINHVINKIEEYLHKRAKVIYRDFQKTDIKETWADIKKAEKILGWKPKVNFNEGLKNTIDWYIRNEYWLKDIKLQ